MPVERVDVGDSRLEDYRNVRHPESLRSRGVFVAEGRLVVERLLDQSREYDVMSVLVNEASLASLEPQLLRMPRLQVFVCSTEQLMSIVGFNLHRGCLAIARRPEERRAGELLDCTNLVLILEDVTDADNVGAAFRNAAAFGAGAVLLSPGCCDPLYRKAVRTSMGAVLRVRFARISNWPHDLGLVRNAGFTVAALTPRETSIPLAEFTARRPHKIALMIGTEGRGLSDAADAIADARVRIPMRPGVDSLNLATAAGIALYQLTV
jgi:tRNA G18 (ribose-2'-O)-methylase SpoU